MDKKIYYLAVLENSEGDKQHIMTHDNEKFFREYKDLETLGYRVVQYVGTTCRTFYTKARCKVRVQELKDLEQKRMEHVVKLYETKADEKVIADTEKLYKELERVLIEQVGMAYSRFLRANKDEEFEYNDELALACYNMRESRMRVTNQLMKSTYYTD